jgi:hypothetical protein
MVDTSKRWLRRVADKHRHQGARGVAGSAINGLMVRWGSIEITHVMLLERARVLAPPLDTCFETGFLTPSQVRRFANDPANRLPNAFVDRAERGLDLCYAAIHGDRLASYGWYALHSIEAEHAAGAALGLPDDLAYMYKGFTHPDYRGQRLYGACMGRAFELLAREDVTRLMAFVHWSNAPSLRSCDLLGYRRLGSLVAGPRGPIHVPSAARRLGVRFGSHAEAALESRARWGSTLARAHWGAFSTVHPFRS